MTYQRNISRVSVGSALGWASAGGRQARTQGAKRGGATRATEDAEWRPSGAAQVSVESAEPRLENLLDRPVEDCVEDSEVGGQDRDEHDRDRRRLNQRLAVGPLDPLELRPAGDEEADDRAALALGRLLLRRPAAL